MIETPVKPLPEPTYTDVKNLIELYVIKNKKKFHPNFLPDDYYIRGCYKMIKERNYESLLTSLKDSRNRDPIDRKLFETYAGVKLGSTKQERIKQILEWAGQSYEQYLVEQEEYKEFKERLAKKAQAKDIITRASVTHYETSDGSISVKDFIDERFKHPIEVYFLPKGKSHRIKILRTDTMIYCLFSKKVEMDYIKLKMEMENIKPSVIP